jgi:hypothetical protein
MVVSNLVQGGASNNHIAETLAISEKIVRTYVTKAHRSPSQSLVGMVVSNLLPTGASDEDIADALAISPITVEKYIANVPLKINGEESVSQPGAAPEDETPMPAGQPEQSDPTAKKMPPSDHPPDHVATPVPLPPGSIPSSHSAAGRRLIGIVGVILSPLLFVVHAHATRRRTRQETPG